MTPAIELQGATLTLGGRTLWAGLDLELAAGEFLAVLGPNGAGKTSLLRVLLGLQRLTAGSAQVAGRNPRRGRHEVGYLPQQRGIDRDIPLRGQDLVRFGLDGTRFGWTPGRERAHRARLAQALATVGATDFADTALGLLSGGEQQRLRVAQALLTDPVVLLCDEPLLSLDLGQQQAVSALIDARRRDHDTAIVLVTHEINPVLPMVDRVLYLTGGAWAVGRPDEVLTTETLSGLYGAPVDVLRVRDRIVVIGAPDAGDAHGHDHGAA